MYYWKQTDWNEYTLVPPVGVPLKFKSYGELYSFCTSRNLEVTQA